MNQYLCSIEKIEPSSHKEFGSVVRVKIASLFPVEIMDTFYGTSGKFEPFFDGSVSEQRSVKLTGCHRTIKAGIYAETSEGEKPIVITTLVGNVGEMTIKQQDEEVTDHSECSIVLVCKHNDQTEMFEGISDKHFLENISKWIKQNVLVTFDEAVPAQEDDS